MTATEQMCDVSSIWVKKEPELAYFEVDVEQEIKFKERLLITVSAKDREDQVFALEGSTQLTFAIEGAKTYATFIGTDGKEVQVIPVFLFDVSYGEATSGKILLSATVANPEEPIKQRVKVYLQGDPSKKGEKEVTVNPGLVEILLGETKYFQARESFDQEHLIIDEVPTPEIVGEGIAIDVWGDDPVEKRQGDKLGVYWEKRRTIYGTTDTQPEGVIRIVGRYWGSDQTYKVELKATRHYESRSKNGVLDVKVSLPTKLGDLPNAPINVKGEPENLDLLILEFASSQGIPPQILKAQISKESAFKPAYRWEPFLDTDYHFYNKSILSNQHVIRTSTDLGHPGIPSDHTNVYPNRYWGYAGTIWDLMFAHSWDLNPNIEPNSVEDLYSRYNSRGDLIWSYEEVANHWHDIVFQVFNKAVGEGFSFDEALIMSRDSANYWLRYQYRNGFMNNLAQTRISASYGVLQVLYGTALSMGFEHDDDHHPPESININKTVFSYAVPYLLKQLGNENKEQANAENNWTEGWEKTLQAALSRYNKPSLKGVKRFLWKYGVDVMRRSVNYIPTK